MYNNLHHLHELSLVDFLQLVTAWTEDRDVSVKETSPTEQMKAECVFPVSLILHEGSVSQRS